MRLFNDAKGYATQANAIQKLERTLSIAFNLPIDDVQWMVVVNDKGRYVPAVRVNNDARLVQLAHVGICVF